LSRKAAGDQRGEVRQQLADQPELMEELTPPPALGTLNLQEIAGSDYMFA